MRPAPSRPCTMPSSSHRSPARAASGPAGPTCFPRVFASARLVVISHPRLSRLVWRPREVSVSSSKRIPVAVLGATGSVGQRFVQLLADHPWFELAEVVASDRSAGQTYADAAD